MSTERSSFGFNSFLPTSYMSKAEAFAKCLQDKLRNIGGGDESSEINGQREQSPKVFRFSDEDIADNVFLQGPLSYKRRSIPERTTSEQKPANGAPKYFGSLIDKRGLSSDSEDSNSEDGPEPRITQLENSQLNRLVSVNSVDSTASWCSCEEGPDQQDDEELVDALALQVKGSPPVNTTRFRNFRRRGREEKSRKDKPAPLPHQDSDLFFDFDVECFSPVNVEDESDLFEGFQTAQLRLEGGNVLLESDESRQQSKDDKQFLQKPDIVTPPPSPANEKTDISYQLETDNDTVDANIAATHHQKHEEENKSESISKPTLSPVEYGSDVPISQLSEVEQSPSESPESAYSDYYRVNYAKDSGISSCEETSSRAGDEDIPDDDTRGDMHLNLLLPPDPYHECNNLNDNTEIRKVEDCNTEDYIERKRDVTAPIMVMCDGVLVDESYLPSPRMKLRRCSSLKTWKTPPGTPGRKKIVRFADALGLDLADVRTFLDEIPKIPNSAFEDLHYELPPGPAPPTSQRTLIPMFQQPGTQMDFLQRVRLSNVCLESAVLTDVSLLSIAGIVRVRNLSFHKTVHVRYSKDNWISFSDMQATFVPNSSDGFCDNFSFTLYGHTLDVGSKLEFAIRYDCASGQFWDNNLGNNYVFHCLPRNDAPLFPPLGSSPVDTWTKFY